MKFTEAQLKELRDNPKAPYKIKVLAAKALAERNQLNIYKQWGER